MPGITKKLLFIVLGLCCALAGPACVYAGGGAGKFYTAGDAGKPLFALTFDDGPGYITADLLKLLDKYGAKASFFMTGQNVRSRAPAALAVFKAGHLVGNHTYAHLNYFKLDKAADKEKILAEEILKARLEIEKATGAGTSVLRMPNGYHRAWVARVAAASGYALVNWTYGSDWTRLDEEKMTEEYLKNLRPGAILLLHDGGGREKAKTLRITEKILIAAGKRALKPVRLDELLGLAPEHP